MSETAKHTPGPWFVDEDDPHSLYAPDGDADPWFVAEAAYDCGPDVSGKANAAHIVKCVNAYDELVGALQRAEWALGVLIEERFGKKHKDNPLPGSDLAAIRTALLKAGC